MVDDPLELTDAETGDDPEGACLLIVLVVAVIVGVVATAVAFVAWALQ